MCLDTTKFDVRSRLLTGLGNVDHQARAVWASSAKQFHHDYKAGGTALVTFSNAAGQVRKQGTDPLGRWAYQLLGGSKDTKILIISVYQCGKRSTKKIGLTAFHQQQTLLSEMNREDVDPRRNFHQDLTVFIQK